MGNEVQTINMRSSSTAEGEGDTEDDPHTTRTSARHALRRFAQSITSGTMLLLAFLTMVCLVVASPVTYVRPDIDGGRIVSHIISGQWSYGLMLLIFAGSIVYFWKSIVKAHQEGRSIWPYRILSILLSVLVLIPLKDGGASTHR
jgi:hypothetical protein